MWYVMSNVQQSYDLSDRLIRAITGCQSLRPCDDDIEQLLEEGANVNGLHGLLLPLHCACMVSDPYNANLLLEHGAKVNAIDGYGRAAIHYAAEKDAECVELLLNHGADPNIKDANQDTALHWASFKNLPVCVKTLLQNGANVNAVDYDNDTAIGWAARKGNLETIKVLLEYNAQVDIINYQGQTALMKAASIQATGLNSDQDDACFELLIKANGQFDLRNQEGLLPSIIQHDNKLQDLLLPYCKNPRTLNDLGRFAIRAYIGARFLPNVVPKLPIPSRLQEFILLQR